MEHTQNHQTQPSQAGGIAPAMLLGAGFALLAISFFVLESTMCPPNGANSG